MIFFVHLVVNGSFYILNTKSNSFMKYSIKASSIAKVRLRYILRNRNYVWDHPETADSVANPAELF
jgi:hypothetical protein